MEYRRSKYILLIASLFIMTFAGCGKSTGTEEAALVSNSYSYQAFDNGCDTGYHEFATFDQFCSGLEDEKLNHLCAQAARKKFFSTRGCPGTFIAKY